LKNSRRRVVCVLAVLMLALMLAACGTPVNASNTGSSQGGQQPTQQTQYSQPTNSRGTRTGIKGTDQQVQSLLRQLDGAQSDVNNADAGASQDNGLP
jgi:ABC-type oligopeptide transport system substrate-binding subunit